MKIVGNMFREKLIDILTAERDNKVNKIDWFSKTKQLAKQMNEEKRYRETVLAEHMRVDEEGRTVPAFNYDYAIHKYFKERERCLKTVDQKEEVLKRIRSQYIMDLREKESCGYFKHHVFVSAPKIKTLRAHDEPQLFMENKQNKMAQIIRRNSQTYFSK